MTLGLAGPEVRRGGTALGRWAGSGGISRTPGRDPACLPWGGASGALGLGSRLRGAQVLESRDRGDMAAPRDAEIWKDVQVEVAKKYIGYHMEKYGFQVPNVTFIHGYIEKLGEAGIKNESYDIIISNCVINLVPDKQEVLKEVYRVLKHGGELYFSDVYASLELPEEIRTHKVLWGECLGGALYWKDLAILAQKIGFCPPRLVTASLITVQNKEVERVIGNCRFVSATFRLFKLLKTEPAKRCQVIYNGGITGHKKELIFDANFTFKEGEIVEVDEETAAILKNSRFAQDFLITPIGEKLPTCGGCSALESKDVITDPFKLAEESDNMMSRCPPDVASGCCGTKKSC
uniref:Arsenite methyltransferase n=1 Tax=Equus caballus TaxID=9796 RepID=A0A9L0SZY0_HORSE